MNHFIQFTETRANGGAQQYVMQYSTDEMTECFQSHERVWLLEGKIVERGETQAVDLQAWFERTKAL